MDAFSESQQLLVEARRAYEAQDAGTGDQLRSAGQPLGGLNLDV